jgi:hypothetical protein
VVVFDDVFGVVETDTEVGRQLACGPGDVLAQQRFDDEVGVGSGESFDPNQIGRVR